MSTLTTRTFGVSFEHRMRMRPSRVVSHTVSDGLTTFDFSSMPGVQSCDQSSRRPYRSSFSTGALRPCWMRLKYIHVDFALITSAFAVSSPSLKVPVHGVAVHDREVAGLPRVLLVVVDLVALAP